MCQKSSTIEFVELKRDKVVYKVMDTRSSKPGHAYSVFQWRLYKFNELYQLSLTDIQNGITLRTKDYTRFFSHYEVTCGFHSFPHKRDVYKNIRNFKVVKCIIPAGSMILRGTWERTKTPTIVSNQIIIKEILEL